MAKGSSGGMLKGLSVKCPPATDSSMKLGKESVNSEATRSETAPADKTLGPRCA
jgi:hypothetical protein